jgi:hypothetical protein
MKLIVQGVVDTIRAGGTRTADRDELNEWVRILTSEVKANDACQIRTDENDTELRRLLDARCRCNQKLLLMKEGE